MSLSCQVAVGDVAAGFHSDEWWELGRMLNGGTYFEVIKYTKANGECR